MRSEYIPRVEFESIINRMERMNALCMRLSLATALRLSDCLSFSADKLKSQRPTIKEQKTGKSHRVYIPAKLYRDLCALVPNKAGFIFPHRVDPMRHKSRESIYMDFKAQKCALNIKANVSPHTARKIYAVEDFQKHHDIERVKRLLNHDYISTTMLYALADSLGHMKAGKKKRR